MKEPKQTSKWKLRWFRVKMTECQREEKKKEKKLGEARHTGEGQSISDGGGKQWHCRECWKGVSYTPGNVSHCWICKASAGGLQIVGRRYEARFPGC